MRADYQAYKGHLSDVSFYTGEKGLFDNQMELYEKTQKHLLKFDQGYVDVVTGFGKTAYSIKTLEALTFNNEARVLIVGKDKGNIDQFAKELLVYSNFKSDDIGKIYTGSFEPDKKIVFITYRSLLLKVSNGQIKLKDFQMFVFDEAHYGLGEKVSKIILNINHGIRLGLTASVETSKGNVEDLFGGIKNRIIKIGLKKGIQVGRLSSLKSYAWVFNQVDLKNALNKKGQLNESVSNEIIGKSNAVIEGIFQAHEMYNKGEGLTIVSYTGAKQSHALTETAINRGYKAAAISYLNSTQENADIIEKSKIQGAYDFLIYSDMIHESYDNPYVKLLVNARHTGSWRVAIQRLGRLIRYLQGKLAISVDFVYKANGEYIKQILVSDVAEGEVEIYGPDFDEKKEKSKQRKRERTLNVPLDSDKILILENKHEIYNLKNNASSGAAIEIVKDLNEIAKICFKHKIYTLLDYKLKSSFVASLPKMATLKQLLQNSQYYIEGQGVDYYAFFSSEFKDFKIQTEYLLYYLMEEGCDSDLRYQDLRKYSKKLPSISELGNFFLKTYPHLIGEEGYILWDVIRWKFYNSNELLDKNFVENNFKNKVKYQKKYKYSVESFEPTFSAMNTLIDLMYEYNQALPPKSRLFLDLLPGQFSVDGPVNQEAWLLFENNIKSGKNYRSDFVRSKISDGLKVEALHAYFFYEKFSHVKAQKHQSFLSLEDLRSALLTLGIDSVEEYKNLYREYSFLPSFEDLKHRAYYGEYAKIGLKNRGVDWELFFNTKEVLTKDQLLKRCLDNKIYDQKKYKKQWRNVKGLIPYEQLRAMFILNDDKSKVKFLFEQLIFNEIENYKEHPYLIFRKIQKNKISENENYNYESRYDPQLPSLEDLRIFLKLHYNENVISEEGEINWRYIRKNSSYNIIFHDVKKTPNNSGSLDVGGKTNVHILPVVPLAKFVVKGSKLLWSEIKRVLNATNAYMFGSSSGESVVAEAESAMNTAKESGSNENEVPNSVVDSVLRIDNYLQFLLSSAQLQTFKLSDADMNRLNKRVFDLYTEASLQERMAGMRPLSRYVAILGLEAREQLNLRSYENVVNIANDAKAAAKFQKLASNPVGSFLHFYLALWMKTALNTAFDSRVGLEDFLKLLVEWDKEAVHYATFSLGATAGKHFMQNLQEGIRQKTAQKLSLEMQNKLNGLLVNYSSTLQVRMKMYQASKAFMIRQAGLLAGVMMNELLYGEYKDAKSFMHNTMVSYVPFVGAYFIVEPIKQTTLWLVVNTAGKVVKLSARAIVWSNWITTAAFLALELHLAPYVQQSWDQGRARARHEGSIAEDFINLKKFIQGKKDIENYQYSASCKDWLNNEEDANLNDNSMWIVDENNPKSKRHMGHCLTEDMFEHLQGYVTQAVLYGEYMYQGELEAEKIEKIEKEHHVGWKLHSGEYVNISSDIIMNGYGEQYDKNREQYIKDLKKKVKKNERMFKSYWTEQVTKSLDMNFTGGLALYDDAYETYLQEQQELMQDYEIFKGLQIAMAQHQSQLNVMALSTNLSSDEAQKELNQTTQSIAMAMQVLGKHFYTQQIDDFMKQIVGKRQRSNPHLFTGGQKFLRLKSALSLGEALNDVAVMMNDVYEASQSLKQAKVREKFGLNKTEAKAMQEFVLDMLRMQYIPWMRSMLELDEKPLGEMPLTLSDVVKASCWETSMGYSEKVVSNRSIGINLEVFLRYRDNLQNSIENNTSTQAYTKLEEDLNVNNADAKMLHPDEIERMCGQSFVGIYGDKQVGADTQVYVSDQSGIELSYTAQDDESDLGYVNTYENLDQVIDITGYDVVEYQYRDWLADRAYVLAWQLKKQEQEYKQTILNFNQSVAAKEALQRIEAPKEPHRMGVSYAWARNVNINAATQNTQNYSEYKQALQEHWESDESFNGSLDINGQLCRDNNSLKSSQVPLRLPTEEELAEYHAELDLQKQTGSTAYWMQVFKYDKEMTMAGQSPVLNHIGTCSVSDAYMHQLTLFAYQRL